MYNFHSILLFVLLYALSYIYIPVSPLYDSDGEFFVFSLLRRCQQFRYVPISEILPVVVDFRDPYKGKVTKRLYESIAAMERWRDESRSNWRA